MEISITETIEVVLEIICGIVVIGMLSYVGIGYKIIPILEKLLG